MITRYDFFKDKWNLLACLILEVISFYLYLSYLDNIFIIPVTLFAVLGLLELWFIKSKNAEETE